MNHFAKKYLIVFFVFLFFQVQVFSGSFYTATLYPKENTEDVKKLLKGKNFFICSKAEEYNLVTEEISDELFTMTIPKLSLKTEKPIISYYIYDSDVLCFAVYQKGKQVFVLDNSHEYFYDAKIILKGKDNIPALFKIDKEKWNAEISKEKFDECIFADEYLLKILDLLNLPKWVEGIGYRYLAEDKAFVSELKEFGIVVEKYN